MKTFEFTVSVSALTYIIPGYLSFLMDSVHAFLRLHCLNLNFQLAALVTGNHFMKVFPRLGLRVPSLQFP